jgi:hypothetical protein
MAEQALYPQPYVFGMRKLDWLGRRQLSLANAINCTCQQKQANNSQSGLDDWFL